MTPYIAVILILVAFALFHAGTAGNTVSSAIRSRTGLSLGAYMGIRAIVSLSLLSASVYLLLRLASGTLQLFEPLKGVPAILPAMAAFWIAGTALSQVAQARRLSQFFGFRDEPKLFIFTGAYTFCRHPMYTAWLIAGWGLIISQPYVLTVLYNVLISGFVIYMALREERRMVDLFGDKYKAYQKQIPFLLPYGFLKPSIRQEGSPRF